MLRRKFEREMRKRMGRLISEVRKEFEEGSGELIIVNARWTFTSASDALERFRGWLQSRLDVLILGRSGVQDEEGNWTDEFVETAFYKGADQGEQYVNVKSGNPSSPRGISRFLKGPVNLDKLKLLKGRVYEQLKDVTSEMSTKLGNILADGVVKGDSPRTVGRLINKAIRKITKKRAVTIARTETIRAHNEGSLEAMKAMGVKRVGVDVEWTATMMRDGSFEKRVCPQCRALQGMVIDVDKASGLIPRHPNCRCAWIPALGETPDMDDIRKRITKSVRASLGKSKKNKKTSEVMKDSPWIGADLV